jgi:hypothetical protein
LSAESPTKRRARYLRDAGSDRSRHIRRKYGISLEEYVAFFEVAGGRCEGCERQPKKRKDLHLDHDHATGKIRGVLCRDCNHALGNVRDRGWVLENLAKYLKKDSEVHITVNS